MTSFSSFYKRISYIPPIWSTQFQIHVGYFTSRSYWDGGSINIYILKKYPTQLGRISSAWLLKRMLFFFIFLVFNMRKTVVYD